MLTDVVFSYYKDDSGVTDVGVGPDVDSLFQPM